MPVNELKIDLTPHLQKMKMKARRDVLNKALEGNWNTVFKGQGMEFAGYRSYTFSDDASKIDWAASLRAHEVLVRELEEFHNFNVFFMVDVSNSMLFSSTSKLKAEYAAEMVFSLCHSILQGGDAIGLGMFTDRLVSKIPPNLGKDSYYKIMTELSNPKNYGGNYDLVKALTYVRSFLKERSVIIIVSDFIGLQEGWNRTLKMMGLSYDIIGIMVRDPRDCEIPTGAAQYLVEDPYSDKKMFIDAKQYSKLYADEVKQNEEFIKDSFEKAKFGFVKIRTDQDYPEPLTSFFRKRMNMVR